MPSLGAHGCTCPLLKGVRDILTLALPSRAPFMFDPHFNSNFITFCYSCIFVGQFPLLVIHFSKMSCGFYH